MIETKTDEYGYEYREVCDNCGKLCEGVMVDFGAGLVEAWGSSIAHKDEQYVSKCCEWTIERVYVMDDEEVGSA